MMHAQVRGYINLGKARCICADTDAIVTDTSIVDSHTYVCTSFNYVQGI